MDILDRSPFWNVGFADAEYMLWYLSERVGRIRSSIAYQNAKSEHLHEVEYFADQPLCAAFRVFKPPGWYKNPPSEDDIRWFRHVEEAYIIELITAMRYRCDYLSILGFPEHPTYSPIDPEDRTGSLIYNWAQWDAYLSRALAFLGSHAQRADLLYDSESSTPIRAQANSPEEDKTYGKMATDEKIKIGIAWLITQEQLGLSPTATALATEMRISRTAIYELRFKPVRSAANRLFPRMFGSDSTDTSNPRRGYKRADGTVEAIDER
jgi:hypothetical protein